MPTWTKITLSKDDIMRCWNFSNEIIHGENQYDRMMKSGLSLNDRLSYRVKRTFVGKIGEMAFYRFLEQNGIHPGNLDEMFAIFEGQTNVDPFDFQTADGESVDVKTAVFANHKKLVIPIDQFRHIPKDYYVGIKLDLPISVRDYDNSFTPECIKDVYICGFASHEQMRHCYTTNLGEFDCKAKPLTDLRDIAELVALF